MAARAGVLHRDDRRRISIRRPLHRDEQHADCFDRQSCHRRRKSDTAVQGSHDLRQRGGLRSGPENHPHWQPGNLALATCPGTARHAYRLGPIFPHRHRADRAGFIYHPARTGRVVTDIALELGCM